MAELNSVEKVWQFLREKWLSSRVYRSYDDVLDHCYDAWNRLVASVSQAVAVMLLADGRGST